MTKMIFLEDLFEINYGNGLEFYKMKSDKNGIPFVSRTFKNNGIVGKVKNIPGKSPMPKNTITVAVSGSVLESFYQAKDYYTGFHVLCLKPKQKLSKYEMLYYCSIIKLNQYKYNYGRQANRTLKYLLVPSPKNIPKEIKDYKNYENLFKKEKFFIDKKNTNINDNSSKELLDIFDCYGGIASKEVKRYDKKINKNYIAYVRPSKTQTRSVDAYLNPEEINPKHIYPKNTLYVSTDGQGSHSYAYLSIFEFVPNSNVSVLLPKREMTILEKLFYAYLITKNRYKFSYGRKPKGKRLKEILLPEFPNLIKGFNFDITRNINF